MNATAEKFGYPDSLLCELEHWAVLLRPAQVTLGSLILVCRDPAERFGDVSRAAFEELKVATTRLEQVLTAAFAHDKINYLMLMMVDPDVHFHVIPRYAGPREYHGARFEDPYWPGPPDVKASLDMSAGLRSTLSADLKARFG